jgi:HTH-type transcriptional regulator/antitoxin HigA
LTATKAKTPSPADRRPIADDDAHRRAVEVLDGLIDRGDRRTPEEDDYMAVLGLLVEEYEESIYEHPESSPVERLRFLMEQHSLTQAALAGATGVPVQTLSDILNGKRNVSPRVRKALAGHFGVPPALFA